MKNLILFFTFSLITMISKSSVLVVEGKFQNKNIYIQNAFGTNGVGFCATEIKVNGKITTDEINSSAFEIDLASMNIKPGQKVTIEIIHKNMIADVEAVGGKIDAVYFCPDLESERTRRNYRPAGTCAIPGAT